MRRNWLTALGVVLLLLGLGTLGFEKFLAVQTAAEAERIATVLRVQPGTRAADVGAGRGGYAIELARRITPNGYVYATEIDLDKLAAIRLAVARAGLDNVTTIESSAARTGLPPVCCDAVVLRRVYHHLAEPALFLADLFAALRPGGRLAIIDFPPSRLLSLFAAVNGVPDNRGGHGVPPQVVIEELTAVGFTLEDQIEDWGSRDYCLVFRRPLAAQAGENDRDGT